MPDVAPWPEPLALYLAVINVATFSLLALDRWLCARRGTDEALSRTALTLLMFAGGAVGGTLAFLLLDRHTNKRNSAWHIFSLIALLGWALVLVALYVAPLDPTALRAALGRDHTVLLACLGAASGVTFLAFVVDKLIALWNGRGHDVPRVPEIVLLLLALVGGAPGGLLAMLVARHKIRTTAFAAGLPMMLVLQAVVVAYLLQLGLA